MAFKMKNPSMAKLTKAAGDNRTAMKMKEKSPVKKDLDSIDNNRHAPARTKDTVDPADIKKREKKVTSKRVPTDKEARAEAMKNLYKPKAPSKMKKASPAKQKMNMVKGPDGKMVPDFAVDGKGANDMKSATKMKPATVPDKMKPGKATGKAVRQKKRADRKEARQEKRRDKKIVRRLKKGLRKGERPMKGKTPGTGMIFNEKVKEDLKKLPKAAVPMKVKKKIAR